MSFDCHFLRFQFSRRRSLTVFPTAGFWGSTALAATLVALVAGTPALIGAESARADEPSYERAVALWPDIRRPITFVGCKDHSDEFAVMWNGNVSAQTATATDADSKVIRTTKRRIPPIELLGGGAANV